MIGFKIYLNKLLSNIVAVFLLVAGSFSCKKLLDIPPPVNALSEETVYTQNATAITVLSGIYADMTKNASGGFAGLTGISVLTGLSADELFVLNTAAINYRAHYSNELGPLKNNTGSTNWSRFYNYIFRSNAAIEGLSKSTFLSESVKKQLLGEAKFIRAFYYFYLVNLFGDVPLALSTNYKINSELHRYPVSGVYDQIVSDLKDAQELLSDSYLNATLSAISTEKVRPTKWAATALLARVYLYLGKFDKAEEQSTIVIDSKKFSLSTINDVFKANSSEAIFQLQTVNANRNTEDGVLFILPGASLTSANPLRLSEFLISAFELGDGRKDNGNWVKSAGSGTNLLYYAYKYKLSTNTTPGKEYVMIFRLAEQYLIRAEARARLNKIEGAVSDVNSIRTRARAIPTTTIPNPLPDISNTLTSDQLIFAILHERQVELFTEFGHRWFDLKRTGIVDSVMKDITPLKGGIWDKTDALYPLPQDDINKSTTLKQNSGY